MTRRPKQPPPTEPPAADADAILQGKIWLLDVSLMVWRRLLVPSGYTLRELHGVIQVAMGWEGIHLYDFELRAARSLQNGTLTAAITAGAAPPWRPMAERQRSFGPR